MSAKYFDGDYTFLEIKLTEEFRDANERTSAPKDLKEIVSEYGGACLSDVDILSAFKDKIDQNGKRGIIIHQTKDGHITGGTLQRPSIAQRILGKTFSLALSGGIYISNNTRFNFAIGPIVAIPTSQKDEFVTLLGTDPRTKDMAEKINEVSIPAL